MADLGPTEVERRVNSKETRRRILEIRDQTPTTRQQAASNYLMTQTLEFLGQPFDATKLPLSKLYQMRRDPMVAFGLHFVKTPLVKAQWYIDCDYPQVAAFVDNALRRIYGRLILQYCLALDFGFQVIVKRFELDKPDWKYIDPDDPLGDQQPVWNEGSIDAVVWRDFVTLKPDYVEPRWKSDGSFDGVKYSNTGVTGFPFQRKDESNVEVGIEHTLWVTNDRDSVFGSIWGYPRIGHAYRYWWSYWYNWALADRHFEKDADPATIVYYPDEEEAVDENDVPVNMREIALSVGQDARSGSTVALPGGTITSDMDGRPTAVREWEIDFLKGGGNFEAFNDRFEYLDVMKLRSVWVPEQAFLEGKGGTSSRNVASTMNEVFSESQTNLMTEIDNHINKYVIPDIVSANFPELNTKATKITRGFGSEDIELAKQLIQLIGQSDPNELNVDVRTALESYGVPVLTPDQIRQKEEKLAAQAAAAQPPPGPVNENTAVTDTGFYIKTPDKIILDPDKSVAINIELVDEVPSDIEGALAYYEEDTNTVYFAKSVSVRDRMDYIDVLKASLNDGE